MGAAPFHQPTPQGLRDRLIGWWSRWGNELAGLLAFGIVLGLAQYVVGLQARDQEARQQVDLFTFTAHVDSHLTREMSRAVTQTAALTSYVVVRHATLRRSEVHAILEELVHSVPNIRNISLAVGFRIAYVWPLGGNEKAVGLDYRTLPAQWPDVEKAATTGEPVLVGPLDLIQGGRGLIYRTPVRVRGRYWGMLSTVFDAPGLLRGILGDIETDRFEFAVRAVPRGKGDGAAPVWGRQELFEEHDAVVQEIFLPGARWELAVGSRQDPEAARDILLLRGLAFALAALLGGLIYLALVRRTLLRQIALHDSLTGLPNRRLAEDRLKRALRRQARHESTVGVILFIDLDGFKRVNDTHGHRAGDTVLQAVAARVSRALRETDTVGRWGGDELLVLMEDTERSMVDELTERVRRIVALPITYQNTTIQVGASIGRVVFPDDGMFVAELLRTVDQRMYEDKARRKNGHP